MGGVNSLEVDGWTLRRTSIGADLRAALRQTIFQADTPGARCLLDVPVVQQTAEILYSDLIRAALMPSNSVAIQAIAFDKTAAANWKVTWHQDVMFPFARAVAVPGYELPGIKDGVHYARPPRTILEELIAVRVHLDPCGADNGPLRLAPGSHRLGILRAADIAGTVARVGEVTCVADEGEAVVLRPLVLHASSRAVSPHHRRVLHVVFHCGPAPVEPWHRSFQLRVPDE
jgi:ectoine hydroxylase-related dioxygenase (phytanoyl-CoA dioxygenase family)